MSLAESAPLARHANELISTLGQAVSAMEALFEDARRAVAERVKTGRRHVCSIASSARRTGLPGSRPTSRRFARCTRSRSGSRVPVNSARPKSFLVRIGCGEYLAQIAGGIPMSQGEIVRLSDLGLSAAAVAARIDPAVERLIAEGNTARSPRSACRTDAR